MKEFLDNMPDALVGFLLVIGMPAGLTIGAAGLVWAMVWIVETIF